MKREVVGDVLLQGCRCGPVCDNTLQERDGLGVSSLDGRRRRDYSR